MLKLYVNNFIDEADEISEIGKRGALGRIVREIGKGYE